MTTLLIAGLIVLAAYLVMRLSNIKTENTELRAQVASLKRQLVKRR